MASTKNRNSRDEYDPHYTVFRDLMSFRIREVLLVSSLYDFYVLEEDGQLAESLDVEFYQLKLSYSPRITRVSTGKEALAVLESGAFDLVITMARVGEMDVLHFGREVKKKFPDLPVVLLADSPAAAGRVKSAQSRSKMLRPGIDQAFVWRGDVSVFLAIIKYIEDKRNIDRDTKLARVRTILLVENSSRFYSSYLPLLYAELMKQTHALMADGVNTKQRLRRMRARTRVLLAETFEEGWELFEKYKKYILGIISDARFPREGKSDPEAGLKFLSRTREKDPEMPFLVQSSDEKLASKSKKMGAGFLNKRSPHLLEELSRFLRQDLGFGDFVFILPGGREVGRVHDIAHMADVLAEIPEESIHYHAIRNHFSNWCMARTEFGLAAMLRPRKVSEFKDTEEIRQHLITSFSRLRTEVRLGVVADFSRAEFTEMSGFARIGSGSLGGKGRGLGFINSLLSRIEPSDHDGESDDTEEAPIHIPPSAVIGTDVFDDFMKMNNLSGIALSDTSDDKIAKAFQKSRLPDSIVEDLKVFVDRIRYPIAVRSSSLLEDSYHHAFAGIYRTTMLANIKDSIGDRLSELCETIKLIYASTFFRNAKAYLQNTPLLMEEEKMAVVIQKLVGRRYGKFFYPDIAGVARSYNYYPLQDMKPGDGVAVAALGLGKTVVDGNRAVRFSPTRPQILPQFFDTKACLENAQREFYALDLSRPGIPHLDQPEGWLVLLDLSEAEKHGTLAAVGSVYSPDNNAVYSGISRSGIRLVTFSPILKTRIFPLPRILSHILDMGSRALGCAVEIEFAANLNPGQGKAPEFAFLQIRPMTVDAEAENLDALTRETDPDRIFCRTSQALGHGRIRRIRDVVYIKPEAFDRSRTVEIACEVESINRKLVQDGRPFLLVGPGRWGTADRWLGIPVEWHQISGVKAVVETDMEGIAVAPSEGTHFFQNLTSLGIGYFSIHEKNKEGWIDFAWLDRQKARNETSYLRHIVLKRPLDIRVDGRSRRGIILRQPSGE